MWSFSREMKVTKKKLMEVSSHYVLQLKEEKWGREGGKKRKRDKRRTKVEVGDPGGMDIIKWMNGYRGENK